MRTTILLLLLTTTLLRAQTPTPQPRFALEITEDATPPFYAIIQDGDSRSEATFFSTNLHPLPDRAVDARKPFALKLTSTTAGDEVELTATLAFGEIDKADTTYTLQNNPHQELGTYALHLNEAVVLRDMEQFGVQPWTIKIVNAQLPTPRTLPGQNLVPSIRPEILGVDRQGYRIALHNLASQAVTAFRVDVSSDHNSTSIESSFHAPLIARGATHEFHLFCDPTSSAFTGAAAPDQPTCAFFLEAALFADDSYEGDPEAAAQLLAPRIVREVQTKRVHELIDNILADSSLDDSSKLSPHPLSTFPNSSTNPIPRLSNKSNNVSPTSPPLD